MEKHGRQLKPQANPSIQEQLRIGERYFLTTHGPCDCGTSLGSLGAEERALERRKAAAEKEAQQLTKKGWSKAKLERWRAQKQAHLARPRHRAEPTEWVELIHDLLASGHTSSFALLLHWYAGLLEGRIQVTGRTVVELTEVTAGMLGRMQEDVIYEFVRPGR